MSEYKSLLVIIRILIVALLSVLGWFVFYYFVKLTYPFLIAFVLAFFINPVVTFLERTGRFPRILAVLSGILFLFGLVGGLLTLLIIKVIDGVQYLSHHIPRQIEIISTTIQTYFNEQVLPLWNNALGLFDSLEESQRKALEEGIQQIGVQFASLLGSVGQGVANGLSKFVGALPVTLTVAVFIILGLYFISKDWYRFKRYFQKELPDRVIETSKLVYHDLKSKVVGFIAAQIILVGMTTGVILIGLLILRVEQPFTIALIIGLVDLLPYLGTGLILVPWGIYHIMTGNLFLGVGLVIIYGAVIIQRQLAEPKVLSSNLGLNPLAVLVALFVGLQLFGVLGLVIGPVVLVLFISFYEARAFDGVIAFIKGETKIKD